MDAATATFSRCGRWRQHLGRRWADGPLLLWVMLNPSTADAAQDDPTIRRCRALAAAQGFGAMAVVNLYAWRATRPADLWRAADPVGPGTDRRIAKAARSADAVCVAWGAQPRAAGRVPPVLALLRRHHAGPLWCLGTTRDGHPRHPLYVRRDVPLQPFGPSAIDAATLQAFHTTGYQVHLPGAPFTLHIGQASPALAALHAAHGVAASVFITAWNPGCRRAGAADNARQQQALRQALHDRGCAVVDGIGQHPSNGWPGEDSLLALGVPLADALVLGRRFGQDAVVWAGADAMPRLLLLR